MLHHAPSTGISSSRGLNFTVTTAFLQEQTGTQAFKLRWPSCKNKQEPRLINSRPHHSNASRLYAHKAASSLSRLYVPVNPEDVLYVGLPAYHHPLSFSTIPQITRHCLQALTLPQRLAIGHHSVFTLTEKGTTHSSHPPPPTYPEENTPT